MKKKIITYSTASDQETILLGRRLGEILKEGDVVALVGELGSGKTWLSKGIALGLGVETGTVITSPSFAIVNEYRGRCTLYHMDLYRLASLEEFMAAGLEEYLYEGGVAVIEWADRWPEILPEQTVVAAISISDETSREIVLSGSHERAVEILEVMETRGAPGTEDG